MINTMLTYLKPFISCPETEEYLRITASAYYGTGERHHILPESLFPEYASEDWNLVNLSYENHYRVHELLPFMLNGQHKYKMLCAWNQMCGRTRGEFISVDRYATLKKEFSENNPSKRDEVKQIKADKWELYWSDPKNRQKRADTNPNKGKKFPERGKKISAAKKGKPSGTKGLKRSAEYVVENLVGTNNPMARAVVCDGLRFDTLTDAGKYFGYTKQAVVYWIKRGRFRFEDSPEVAYTAKDFRTSAIRVGDVDYATMKEASENLDVTMTTLRNWIKSGKATKLPKEPK